VVAFADWLRVERLSPSNRLSADDPVMSAVPTFVVPDALSPVKELAVLVPRASPEVTSLFFDVFFASTEVLPEDTTPVTCPPTASPDLEVPLWLPVDRLLPCCTFVPVALVTSARATLAVAIAPEIMSTAASTDLITLVI
jgi:hypothetical protein